MKHSLSKSLQDVEQEYLALIVSALYLVQLQDRNASSTSANKMMVLSRR